MNSRAPVWLALGCALVPGAAAQTATLDMASYLALAPGNWAILQDTQTAALSGYVTSVNGAGQTVQTWYRFQGGGWVFDSAELFTVTNRRITYLGTQDGSATWLFEPTLSFMRRWQVDDAVTYKGAMRNQSSGELMPVNAVFSVTAQSLAVSVPAGAFTNCIKVRNYSYGGGGSRDSVSIACPGRAEAKTWYTKIKDLASPTDEDQSEVHAAIMIQAGDTNPPLP